jgi:hypothetical protein
LPQGSDRGKGATWAAARSDNASKRDFTVNGLLYDPFRCVCVCVCVCSMRVLCELCVEQTVVCSWLFTYRAAQQRRRHGTAQL